MRDTLGFLSCRCETCGGILWEGIGGDPVGVEREGDSVGGESCGRGILWEWNVRGTCVRRAKIVSSRECLGTCGLLV